MRSTAFFKLYKICILLHRCKLNFFAKNWVEKTAIFVKFQQKKLQMSQNLQNFVKFQKIQLENLVDFEKCCKTHIYLQKSEPIQPKTSSILPKFCQPTLSDVSASKVFQRVVRNTVELVLGVLRQRDRADAISSHIRRGCLLEQITFRVAFQPACLPPPKCIVRPKTTFFNRENYFYGRKNAFNFFARKMRIS